MLELVQVLRAACCVAGLDGNISPNELAILQKLAAEAGVGQASLNAMMNRAKSDPNYFQDQFNFLRGNPDEAMKTLLRVAVADGNLHPNERVVLQHLASKLGINEERLAAYLAVAEKRVDGTASQA